MDYFLNEEQRMILKVVQDIAKDKIQIGRAHV